MRWQAHLIIGVGPALVFNVYGIIPSAIGSILPDLLETFLDYFKLPVKHRLGPAHYLSNYVIGLLFSIFIFDFYDILFWLNIGAISHIITDSMTPTGVKLSPFSLSATTLFSGRFKNGTPAETILSSSIFVISLFIAINFSPHNSNDNFRPFFTDYEKLYNEGILTGKEWREKRFIFF